MLGESALRSSRQLSFQLTGALRVVRLLQRRRRERLIGWVLRMRKAGGVQA